jgi:hypothetical protein
MTVFLVYTFREPKLLARSIRMLSPHKVVVHVDAKVDITPFTRAIAPEDRERVFFISERVRVNWGGYSQVQAIRSLVQRGILLAQPTEYLVLLSGQDYPIRPMKDLDALFEKEQGRQFLRYFEISKSEQKYKTQIARRHHRDLRFLSSRTNNQHLRRIRNASVRVLELASKFGTPLQPPEGFRVAHGVTHFAMTAEFANALEDSVNPTIERFFRAVFVAEEKFYPSLAANLGEDRIPVSSMPVSFEAYSGPGNWRYANLHHIDPSLTKVYTETDWDEVKSSPSYFLRKLESDRSSLLLQMIDKALLRE